MTFYATVLAKPQAQQVPAHFLRTQSTAEDCSNASTEDRTAAQAPSIWYQNLIKKA